MGTNEKVVPSVIICPVCGLENDASAVFCGNPACGKALGEFRYVLEELKGASSRMELLADHVAGFVGNPHFITLHLLWFVLWALFNSGLVAVSIVFDQYPYSLLGLILSVEATLVTAFLLISNNRQNAHANIRAQLDYEVNVQSFRAISRLATLLEEINSKIDALDPRSR